VKTFLVFEPADGSRDTASADRILFLREKFRWLALFFAPLWLLWHRLWVGFLGWLVAVIAIAVAAAAFGLTPQAAAPLLWLPTLIVAFEGTELLRRKLLRRGYREAGAIVGRDLEDAERRFFATWSARPEPRAELRASPSVEQSPAPPPASPRPAANPQAPSANPVLGLFPQPSVRR
jgi:hypothetical protein